MATSYNNIGQVWHSKGEYDKALEYYEKGLAIYLKTLGGEHPDVATSYNNIGQVWKNKGETNKALEYFEKCLVIHLKTLGGDHPLVAASYYNIGLIWENKREYDKALEYYENSLAIDLKTKGGEHPDVAFNYFNIGKILKDRKNYKVAIENIKIGYAINKQSATICFFINHNLYGASAFPFYIAQCYEALNDKVNALDFFIQSAEIGKEHPKIGLDAEAIQNALRVSKELGKENELPAWMKVE